MPKDPHARTETMNRPDSASFSTGLPTADTYIDQPTHGREWIGYDFQTHRPVRMLGTRILEYLPRL